MALHGTTALCLKSIKNPHLFLQDIQNSAQQGQQLISDILFLFNELKCMLDKKKNFFYILNLCVYVKFFKVSIF
jgi:hypothetical protein